MKELISLTLNSADGDNGEELISQMVLPSRLIDGYTNLTARVARTKAQNPRFITNSIVLQLSSSISLGMNLMFTKYTAIRNRIIPNCPHCLESRKNEIKSLYKRAVSCLFPGLERKAFCRENDFTSADFSYSSLSLEYIHTLK